MIHVATNFNLNDQIKLQTYYISQITVKTIDLFLRLTNAENNIVDTITHIDDPIVAMELAFKGFFDIIWNLTWASQNGKITSIMVKPKPEMLLIF